MSGPRESDNPDQEQPFISHLLELRDRILRMVMAIGLVFVGLFPFANDIYVVMMFQKSMNSLSNQSMVIDE